MNQSDSIYRDDLIEEARSPGFYGNLPDANLKVQASNVSCGDTVELELKLDANGIIKDLRWHGEGCLISRVAASRLASLVVDKKLQQAAKISVSDLMKELKLENITPMRAKCVEIALSALKNAAAKYQPEEKNNK